MFLAGFSSTLKMEELFFSETSVEFYPNIRRYIQKIQLFIAYSSFLKGLAALKITSLFRNAYPLTRKSSSFTVNICL
jgi:hypothetical protein